MKSNITVPEATVPSLTQQETNLEEVLTVVADPKATNTHAQEDDQGFITVSSAKKQKLRHVEVAQKTCARVTGTGTPIPIRAERRARMLDSQVEEDAETKRGDDNGRFDSEATGGPEGVVMANPW